MMIHRDRRSDVGRRQRTARRFAVAPGSRLRASSTLGGLPGPPCGTLLRSRLPGTITAIAEAEGRP